MISDAVVNKCQVALFLHGKSTHRRNNLPLTSNHRTAFQGIALRAIQQLAHSLTAVNDIDFRFGGGVLYGPLVLYGKKTQGGRKALTVQWPLSRPQPIRIGIVQMDQKSDQSGRALNVIF